ncbi:MAG: cupin domain-containing protein [Bacteroidales bacterium]|nr:cupin domain-containing protein [Bacteroidales bacterium]
MEFKMYVAPKKFSVKETVSYAEGAVVSKQSIKQKGGNVTFFAFDKGEGLSEHTAPFDAMVVVLDGTARITIGGDPFELIEGEAITMPANVPHALFATERFKMMLVMVKGEVAEK